ncbi:hypothetical protein TRICI_001792 [Trichomonascus ciferrii]|uniref:HECT-type E3 ubiquitin transferase n=1 Tax=Trichomonascus ciferrii TaxID=44093 RepID=A0A642V8N6_9ASCO|nr:hypothetical protein TRICI_001792 [Trichomonascus ciferrii]
MPSWGFFTRKSSKASKKDVSSKQQASEAGRPNGHSVPERPWVGRHQHSVSTMSSVGEIVHSVSAANAAAVSSSSSTANSNFGTVSKGSGGNCNSKLTVRKCICCGTKLQVPEGVAYFKCSICETFHDLKEVMSPGPVTALTLAGVEEAIEQDKMESVEGYPHLESLLSAAAGSVESLNTSFRSGLDRLSYSKPDLDFGSIEAFYSLLLSLDLDGPMKTFVTSCIALLKRVRCSLETPDSIYFLLIILENPLLYNYSLFSAKPESGKHSQLSPYLLELLERGVGVLAHCPKKPRHYLLNWFTRYPLERFEPKVDLLNAYIAHRLTVHYNNNNPRRKSRSSSGHSRTMSAPATQPSNPWRGGSGTSMLFQSQYNGSSGSGGHYRQTKKRRGSTQNQIRSELYGDDWKIAGFVRVLAILFNANTVGRNKIPISSFYNSMVDFTDVASDFDEWQKWGVPTSTLSTLSQSQPHHRSTASHGGSSGGPSITLHHGFSGDYPGAANRQKVAFCQYPFVLSMGSKTQILEYDARRQMEYKAQEAFFGSLDRKCAASPFLYIRVRRENILQDSFEAFEHNEDDLKKSLRIQFVDEPGVDAGGLRKEWFLLLIRELFNPESGIFVEEEDSKYFWFEPTGEKHPLKYYKLAGVAIGLALYNSTILDIHFPPVMFKKLLGCPYTLEDFTVFRPSYGRSLRQLLDYDGDDFEDVFGLNFCVSIKDQQGNVIEEPLIVNGEDTPVTKANRQDYVRRVMTYLLDTSVRRQFEPFKQGFYNVVGGNALTLFRPEEIELLLRGSPEPVDVDALQSVTKYQNCGPKGYDSANDLVVRWFWKYFKSLPPDTQRKLLMFVTGSDRIPATGIANMSFRISKIGEDTDRFPTSHTCFNQLCLYSYSSRAKLEQKMNVAINESQGFGIK